MIDANGNVFDGIHDGGIGGDAAGGKRSRNPTCTTPARSQILTSILDDSQCKWASLLATALGLQSPNCWGPHKQKDTQHRSNQHSTP